MFPIIPLICVAGFLSSALGLGWYTKLSKQQQAQADRHAAELAMQLYDKALDELADHQVEVIHRIVNRKYAG